MRNPPSFGSTSGSSVYSGFGNYKGLLDELRIYDRGLVEGDVNLIFNGDSLNEGFLEFRAIEKPVVVSKSPIDILPTQATLRAEVISIGGEVNTVRTVTDQSFKTDTVPWTLCLVFCSGYEWG
jgi:hypothetical protein